MTLGPTAFAAVIWGAVAFVLAVFGYQMYAVLSDLGWLADEREPPGT